MKFIDRLNPSERILFDEKLERIALIGGERVYRDVDHLAERIRATLWEKDLKLTKERTLMLMIIALLETRSLPVTDIFRKILKAERYKIEDARLKPSALSPVPEQPEADGEPGTRKNGDPVSCSEASWS